MANFRMAAALPLAAVIALSACSGQSAMTSIPQAQPQSSVQSLHVRNGTSYSVFPASAQLQQTSSQTVLTFNGRSVRFPSTVSVERRSAPANTTRSTQNLVLPYQFCSDCGPSAPAVGTTTGGVTSISMNENGDLYFEFNFPASGTASYYVDGVYGDTLNGPANGSGSVTWYGYGGGSTVNVSVRDGNGNVIGTGKLQK